MSHDVNRPNDPWAQSPQPPRQKSGASGLLIGCLIVGGVLALLCCGGGIWVFYSMQPTIVEQPAEVRQMADEIAQIDVPQGLEPRRGFKMKMFWVVNLNGVVYESDAEKGGMMMLMHFDTNIEGMDQTELRKGMSQGIGDADKNITITQSKTKDFTIRGQLCQFTFSEGKNTETGEQVRTVRGTFPGKESGAVMLWMFVPADRYDEAELEKMVKSIK